ncbi:4'-phosphopantetheinyl transferase [Pleurotus eryngii]|uniref:4'-phosphopantetheinyl transferase n=1 Tax=Pleurotus eryngii TaxID=5323 RepID=A0A9P6A2H1_PLEER|nr:4'-phosphopantetheinyl transferase [Pleurotus eryngii]
MSIVGIGVDIVHLPRISALLARRGSKFPSRILSSNELSSWPNVPSDETSRSKFLAVRWAVKEAAYKALYPMFRPTWKELTYRSLTDGRKPEVIYHCDSATSISLHVSVSHDGEYVFATVLAEK